jgi:hypothetical protein
MPQLFPAIGSAIAGSFGVTTAAAGAGAAASAGAGIISATTAGLIGVGATAIGGAIIKNQIPKAAAPAAAPKPQAVVRASSPEVMQTSRAESRMIQKKRRGIGATIIAGGNPGLSAGKQLLGGS